MGRADRHPDRAVRAFPGLAARAAPAGLRITGRHVAVGALGDRPARADRDPGAGPAGLRRGALVVVCRHQVRAAAGARPRDRSGGHLHRGHRRADSSVDRRNAAGAGTGAGRHPGADGCRRGRVPGPPGSPPTTIGHHPRGREPAQRRHRTDRAEGGDHGRGGRYGHRERGGRPARPDRHGRFRAGLPGRLAAGAAAAPGRRPRRARSGSAGGSAAAICDHRGRRRLGDPGPGAGRLDDRARRLRRPRLPGPPGGHLAVASDHHRASGHRLLLPRPGVARSAGGTSGITAQHAVVGGSGDRRRTDRGADGRRAGRLRHRAPRRSGLLGRLARGRPGRVGGDAGSGLGAGSVLPAAAELRRRAACLPRHGDRRRPDGHHADVAGVHHTRSGRPAAQGSVQRNPGPPAPAPAFDGRSRPGHAGLRHPRRGGTLRPNGTRNVPALCSW